MPGRAALAGAGAIAALTGGAVDPAPAVAAAAAGALVELARSRDGLEALLACPGALERCVGAVGTNPPMVTVLMHVGTVGGARGAGAVVAAGGVPPAVAVLASGTAHPTLRSHAAMLVRGLAATPGGTLAAIEAGGVAAAVAGLSAGSVPVRLHAAGALHGLAVEAAAKRGFAAGPGAAAAATALVVLCRDGDADVRRNARLAAAAIAEYPPGLELLVRRIASDLPLLREVFGLSSLGVLNGMLLDAEPGARAAAVAAFAAFVGSDEGAEAAIQTLHVVKRLAAARDAAGGDAATRNAAMLALSALAARYEDAVSAPRRRPPAAVWLWLWLWLWLCVCVCV